MIESVQNEKIKYYKKLRGIKYIKEYNEFIVEGEHLVQEAINSGYAKEIILLGGRKYDTALPKVYVTEKVLKNISTLDTPQYVMALCNVPSSNEISASRIVILDDVRDPGNLGTIIRTCVAFNIDTIVLSKACACPYNDKVVRSSQGMIFKINIVEKDLVEYVNEIKNKGIKVYGADLNASQLFGNIEVPSSYALIFGNEGAGIKKELLNLCDKRILIEMSGECESLNVGVSVGIVLYKWRNL